MSTAVAAVAKEHGLISVCDNTFASPYFQRPLDHGIDIVVHSATKYLNGHSDVVGGVVVVERDDLAQTLGYLQNAVGGIAGPFDSFLSLRALKTLHLRMAQHSNNAQLVAEYLEGHPAVDRVLYPGLASHPHPRDDDHHAEHVGNGNQYRRSKTREVAVLEARILSHARYFGHVRPRVNLPGC